jgi:hypothetical protein
VPGPAGGIWSRLEEPERRARLEAAASEAFERPVRLVLELREAAADAPGSGSGSSPDGHRSRGGSRPGGRTRGGRPSPAAAARRAAQEDPDVRRILQQFDGEIVDIEPAAESAPPPASEDD